MYFIFDIILNELQGISFQVGKDWLTGYGVYDSKTFAEEKKENKTGIRFLRSLKIFYPGFDLAAVQQFSEMHTTQFLVAYKDFNGKYKVAGTLDNPLNFKYKLATGKTGSNAQGYDMEFFADSSIRIVSTDINPDANIYNDWFLPASLTMLIMYNNLHLFGLGNFLAEKYATSSERNATEFWQRSFLDGAESNSLKSVSSNIRACRIFQDELGSYNLRDVGPAGGLIFYIIGNDYYESSLQDLSLGQIWSNVINSLIGTTSRVIGTGEQNTQDIINQAGHTDSAAKLCDDLSITN